MSVAAMLAVGLVALLALLFAAPAANAATLHSYAGPFGVAGSGPGQFNVATMPQRVAVHDPSGKVFAADRGNQRVQVLTPTPTGLAFAFEIPVPAPVGVAVNNATGDLFVSHGSVSAVNELQSLTFSSVSSGTYTLSFGGQMTEPIVAAATAVDVRGALEALPNVGIGNVTVSGGTFGGFGTLNVTFVGALAGANQPQIVVNSGDLNAGASITVATTANGAASATPQVRKFNPDNPIDPTGYTADPDWVSPAIGTGEGQIGALQSGTADRASAGGLAVDPTNGQLIVADVGRNLVQRFNGATGAYVSSFNGCYDAVPIGFCIGLNRPAFVSIRDIAVYSNGDVLVADVNGANGRIDRFSPTGDVVKTLSSANNPVANPGLAAASINSGITVAVNSVTNEAFVSSSMSTSLFSSLLSRIYHFDNDTLVDFFSAPAASPSPFTGTNFNGPLHGIAVRGASPGRLYAMVSTQPPGFLAGNPQPRMQVWNAIVPPVVTQSAPTAVTATTATFSGTVDPDGGGEAGWQFRYRPAGGGSWLSAPVPAGSVPGGSDPVAVQHAVTGLDPNSDYEVKLVANAGTFEVESGVETFTTLVTPPVVDTAKASYLTDTSAVLVGGVNPRLAATGYHFEWGETIDYGQRAPVAADASVGAGNQRLTVRQELTGLEPGTTYHFRIVAENSAGDISRGEDATFTTLDQPLGGLQGERGYELVTPRPMGTVPDIHRVLVSESGDAATFMTDPRALHIPWLEKPHKTLLSERNALGERWDARGIDLPDPGRVIYNDPAYMSPDFSRSFAETADPYDPDDTNGVVDIYMNTGDGKQVWISRGELHDPENPDRVDVGIGIPTVYPANEAPRELFKSALPYNSAFAADGSAVVFGSSRRLLASDPNPSNRGDSRLYKWRNGELTLVSVRADGSAPVGVAMLGSPTGSGTKSGGSPHAVSRDGSRVFWSDGTTIFAQVDGRATAVVGVGEYLDATPDGRRVFYTRDGRIYAHNVDGGDTHDITGPAQLRGVVGVAEPGNRVYYVAEAALPSEPSPRGDRPVAGGPNLYVTRLAANGAPTSTRLIATLDPVTSGSNPWDTYVYGPAINRAAGLSSTGNVLAFGSVAPLVGLPTSSTRQLYVYNDDTGSLECASCPADGSAPAPGPVNQRVTPSGRELTIGSPAGVIDGWVSTFGDKRIVASDGTVFFNTRTRLLPNDYNNLRDVYEYRNGELRLISTGANTANASLFEGGSVDGSTVVLNSGGDYDPNDVEPGMNKLWAARVGGGFRLPTPAAPCAGAGCEGTLQSSPSEPQISSETFRGQGNLKSPPRLPKLGLAVSAPRVAKGTATTIRVRVTRAGNLSTSSSSVRRVSRSFGKPATVRVRIALSPRSRSVLRRRGSIRAKVLLTLKAKDGGATARRSVTVVFRKAGR